MQQQKTTERSKGDRVAFERYLDVLNRALAEVRQRFPFNYLVAAGEKELARRPICVGIHDEDHHHETPIVVMLDNGSFAILDNFDPSDVRIVWRVRRRHVYEVIASPWSYIVDPTRFEFGFLLGLAPRNGTGEQPAAVA